MDYIARQEELERKRELEAVRESSPAIRNIRNEEKRSLYRRSKKGLHVKRVRAKRPTDEELAALAEAQRQEIIAAWLAKPQCAAIGIAALVGCTAETAWKIKRELDAVPPCRPAPPPPPPLVNFTVRRPGARVSLTIETGELFIRTEGEARLDAAEAVLMAHWIKCNVNRS